MLFSPLALAIVDGPQHLSSIFGGDSIMTFRLWPREVEVRTSTTVAALLAAMVLVSTLAALLQTSTATADVIEADTSKGVCFSTGPLRSVVKVIDGETLALDDGSEVRLIGALAPRAWDANTDAPNWQPEQAAINALQRLTVGASVRLYSLGEPIRDRHGRRLAHAYIEMPNTQRRKSLWVQKEMIRLGHARAYGLPGNFHCLPDLIATEASARKEKVGLWANAAYAVRRAKRTGELNRYAGTYQLVRGTVTGVTKRRGVTYINFGGRQQKDDTAVGNTSAPDNSWRTDFTAYVPRQTAKTNPSAKLQPSEESAQRFDKNMIGRDVIVRGWLERYNGPAIRIDDPDQIEIISNKTDK